jgi:hypothetical protein
VLKYGKYTVASRPRHHTRDGVWRPCASVLWYDDKDVVHSHRFNLNRTFDTEEDALLFGFLVARMWVDSKNWPNGSLSLANRQSSVSPRMSVRRAASRG